MPKSAENSGKNVPAVKIGIIVLAFMGAGYLAWRTFNGGSAQVDSEASAVPYVCLECNHVVNMTAADYDRAIHESRTAQGNGDEPQRGRGGGLQCEKCKKFAVTLGARCPKDGTAFPRIKPDWQTGKCPKCGWSLPQS